ncbi:MAG: phosphoribulokinase [Actinomycetota bacterium]
MVLCLACDSASGKSTLSHGVEYILGVEWVGHACTDDYHRFDRAERAGMQITPLAPEASRMDLMAQHLRRLAAGHPVTKPTYGHLTGTFGPDESIDPGEIVIVEGLLPLVDRGTRDAIDVAVFLEPEEMLRRRWKLERDVFERGYSARQVVVGIHRRERDAELYVQPQRGLADIVVRFHRRPGGEDDEHPSARLTVRPTLPYPRRVAWWERCVGRARRRSDGRPEPTATVPRACSTSTATARPSSAPRSRRCCGRRCTPTTDRSGTGSAWCAPQGRLRAEARRWRSHSC